MGKAETNLTNKMRDDAHALYGRERIVIIKQHGGSMSRGGVSDLLICLDGSFIACEVKAPESYGGSVERALDKGPTTNQKSFIAKVLNANGIAAVVATREQFLEVLAEADRRNRENCSYCGFADAYVDLQACPIHPPLRPMEVQ